MRSSTDGTRLWKPMSASTRTPPLGRLHTWMLLLGVSGQASLCCRMLPVIQLLSYAAIAHPSYHGKPDRLHCSMSLRQERKPGQPSVLCCHPASLVRPLCLLCWGCTGQQGTPGGKSRDPLTCQWILLTPLWQQCPGCQGTSSSTHLNT